MFQYFKKSRVLLLQNDSSYYFYIKLLYAKCKNSSTSQYSDFPQILNYYNIKLLNFLILPTPSTLNNKIIITAYS